MQLTITHIYREGNKCADRLANLGLHAEHDFLWYSFLPLSCGEDFLRNQLDLPEFRFS